ncbi:MAG: hypothetical protein J4G16_04525 [Acidobacteria bacterium]|nr:hypothetical protein [Acidobacteriota bacterium]
MSTLPDRHIDRLLRSLFACVVFLTVLCLWRLSHEGPCAALVLPGLIWCAITCGLLHYRLQRKRFVLEFYLDEASRLRGLFRRPLLAVTSSLLAAAPLAAFLAVFAALSRPSDWYFLCAAAVAVPLLFVAAVRWPGSHLRPDTSGGVAGPSYRGPSLREVLAVRIAGWLVLAGMLGAYLYFGYYYIAAPGGVIYPGSLEGTLQAFAARAASACPAVHDTLLVANRIEGLSWYVVTTMTTAPWMQDAVRLLVWIAFLFNSAMVFGGFVRGLEGAVLLAGAAARFRRE